MIKTESIIWSHANAILINSIISSNVYLPVYLWHEKNNPVDSDAVAILTELPQYVVGEGRGTIKINEEQYVIIGYVRRSSKNRKLIINNLKMETKGLIYARLFYRNECNNYYYNYFLKIPSIIKVTKQQEREAKLNQLINENKKPKHYKLTDRPANYKTFTELSRSGKLSVDNYIYAGTCTDTYGNIGHLFIPKNKNTEV